MPRLIRQRLIFHGSEIMPIMGEKAADRASVMRRAESVYGLDYYMYKRDRRGELAPKDYGPEVSPVVHRWPLRATFNGFAMSVVDALYEAQLNDLRTCRWGELPDLDDPGVYVISTHKDPDSHVDASPRIAISRENVDELLRRCPDLTVDKEPGTQRSVYERLVEMWIPDSNIMYVGCSKISVQKRIKQWYKTDIGARAPHSGGWPLKMLVPANELWVHYLPAGEPEQLEAATINRFCEDVLYDNRAGLFDPECAIPFANLDWVGHRKKKHGIRGARASTG